VTEAVQGRATSVRIEAPVEAQVGSAGVAVEVVIVSEAAKFRAAGRAHREHSEGAAVVSGARLRDPAVRVGRPALAVPVAVAGFAVAVAVAVGAAKRGREAIFEEPI
jgi:hypothetical protein